jgi:uncharacterized repeat protein (TIGR01451 family)
MALAARRRIALAASTIAIVVVLVVPVSVMAVQTFPDPFGGEGVFTDIRAGSKGDDIGDAFFLREDDTLQIEMFLDDANFIETHVCISASAFTERLPPGQCQFQETGPGASSYDISLPPQTFPGGTEPFTDPLASFCVQVHVKYTTVLARTSDGGGSAFAGWQSGKPFYGNLCFPDVPDPLPPDEGTAVVTKVGELVGTDVVFTVTATNPTADTAPDVVVVEALPAKLTPWTVPVGCTLGAVDFIARCEIGDLAGGASVDLVFSATPPVDVCGAFSNYALTTVGSPVVRSADLVIVDVPCPDPPPAPDPLILMTKEPSSTSVTAPNTVSYFVSFENAGPGTATNVSFTDELSPNFEWSLGSGSNVCSIDGTTLTCFAATVPDGVFEVLEIIATVDGTDCGTFDNTGTVTYAGGPEAGAVTATAPTVEVTGCSAPTPDDDDAAAGGGGLPDTSTAEPPPIGLIAVTATFAIAASVLTLRFRRNA